MFRLIVLTAWLSMTPAIFYWLRNVRFVKAIIAGFLLTWHSLLTATDQEETYQPNIREYEPFAAIGALIAVISMIVIVLALVVFAGFTIYWAG